MLLPVFGYVAPQSLAEACGFLEKMGGRAAAIAGGTSLLPSMKEKLAMPEYLVDLCHIPGIGDVGYAADGCFSIGALVTLGQLSQAALVKKEYPALTQAATAVASAQIRAMGTVGGNLCQDSLCLYYYRANEFGPGPCFKAGGELCYTVKGGKECWATSCGDLAPALLALGARVEATDATGIRVIPVAELFSGDGRYPHTLRPGQLLTRIILPPAGRQSSSVYLKLRPRKAIDYPALGVAVSISLGEFGRRVAIALTAVDKRPLLIEEFTREGYILKEDDIKRLAERACSAAHPLNNLRDFPPAYRKEMTRVYVHAACQQALRLTGS